MKKRLWLKILLGTVLLIVLIFVSLLIFLTVTEYRPEDIADAEISKMSNDDSDFVDKQMTLYSWNIGYAGLGASSDFFMDGGSNVNPTKEDVSDNLTAIKTFIESNSADAWLLQEVDVNSARTGYTDEMKSISESYKGCFAFAYNYKCEFVPIPLPPIGKVQSGIATFTDRRINGTPERIALPCPFSWPVSTANLKRCLLVTRLALEDSDKEVVIVNLHLEAYDDGEGKIAQTKMLTDFLNAEYEKGNYVIAGGDFNQTFPNTLDKFPVTADEWTPGIMEETSLPEGFRYAFDDDHASCRLLNAPLDESSQMYVLDGFIVSPNVRVDLVETIDLNFANSDHNPVKMQITLLR